MIKTLREAVAGVWSMLVGLKVTGTNFFQPQITVHYPRKTVESLEGYRGHVELVPSDDDPFRSRCVACLACSNICPSGCFQIKLKKKVITEAPAKPPMPDMPPPLDVKAEQHPKKKVKKELDLFRLNYSYCSLCGLCVLNCPAGALRFSDNVYLAGFSRQDFEFDLLDRLRSQAETKEL